jgi:hypothetical protein
MTLSVGTAPAWLADRLKKGPLPLEQVLRYGGKAGGRNASIPS